MSSLPFTLDQLKILKTIIEEGSFRNAAEKLYISQPAVSLQIQTPAKCKVTIIAQYRTVKCMSLTSTGSL